ncbi:MAG: RNA methyltransferase [Sandaracinaceae bacterium]|nr:RNA methyltransferase [Sandaracinaceae bacterium]
MRRDLPEVIELDATAPLPAPAGDVVAVLSPLVTDERLARMNAVIARRTRSLVPVLEDLADPHNGAAVMRSADAFGCHELHVIEDRHPFAVSHRVTRGTHRWLELHKHGSTAACLEHLAANGYAVYVAAMDGAVGPEAIAEVPRAAIVFGNEHKGVSAEVRAAAAGTYAIPMVGFVESLNVSVASAITLYVASRGRHGDLTDDERQAILARYLITQVKDAEGVLRQRLGSR